MPEAEPCEMTSNGDLPAYDDKVVVSHELKLKLISITPNYGSTRLVSWVRCTLGIKHWPA